MVAHQGNLSSMRSVTRKRNSAIGLQTADQGGGRKTKRGREMDQVAGLNRERKRLEREQIKGIACKTKEQ